MTVKRMAVTFLVLLLAGASTASEEGTLGGNCTMGEASDSSLLQQERMLQEPSMGQQMEGPTHATIPGGPIAREGVDDHIAAPWDAEFQVTLELYTVIGKGSCWDSARGHAGGYTAMTSGGNDPVKCLIDCHNTYGDNCAGFDTRDNCLVYTLAGDPANAIVTSKNCDINNNLPDCDHWAGGTCYSAQPPAIHTKKTGPGDAGFQSTVDVSYTLIGKGSCWDSARGYAGGYTAMTSGGNDPVKCLIDCIRTYKENCAGFDTRDNCLVYTLAGDPANAIVMSRNCGINENLPDCDNWAGGTCYSAQLSAIHAKTTGPGDAGFQPTVYVLYTLIGKGACWDSTRGHAGGYTAMTSGGNDPVKCLKDCIRTYKDNCAGFDTRDNCLVYTLAGDPANAIVTSKNCDINDNLPDCDNWAGGTCYSVSGPPSAYVKV